MADNRMSPPKADFYTGGPEDRPRMATQLQRAQAERTEAAMVDDFKFEFEDAESTVEAAEIVLDRRAAGWEFVPPVAGVGVMAWLTFRRAR